MHGRSCPRARRRRNCGARRLSRRGRGGADAESYPLEKIDPADAELFAANEHHGYFARLRRDDPVHYTAESYFGAYWSVTKFDDIVTVEKDPET